MATINGLDLSLLGQTGTGEFVGSVSPTLNQITFSPSTDGIVGTTTNDDATAGFVGEYISSSVSAVPLVDGVDKTVTSISLTAGDWDISGTVYTNPDASTLTQYADCSISLVDNTDGDPVSGGTFVLAAGGVLRLNLTTSRRSFAATTTVYLIAGVSFTVSTLTVDGFIGARRVR